jgi:hypothetical protein
MDSAPRSTVSRTLLPADLCSRYTRTVGLSLLLLVPVCLGHSRLGFTGVRLSKTQNLIQIQQGLAGGAYKMLPAATGRGEQRARSIPNTLLVIGFV